MVSILSNFVVLGLIQYCLGNSDFGAGIETDKQFTNSVSDFIKHKAGARYTGVDESRTSKKDEAKLDGTAKENHNSKAEAGRYNENDVKLTGHEVGENSQGESQSYGAGKNVHENRKSGQEKKGYHRSGFVNSYRKDESGNNSSFYEDSRDEKAQSGHDSRDHYYGKKAENSYKDEVYDGALQGYDKAKKGEFGKGERYNDQHDYQGKYNANAYDDVRRNYVHNGAERYLDRNGNEIYYHRDQQPRHHPYDYPYHYSHGPYPSDYYRRYPQDLRHNHPVRYYHSLFDVDKQDSYNPESRRYYEDSYGNYYRKGNSDHGNFNLGSYLPKNYYEEDVRFY